MFTYDSFLGQRNQEGRQAWETTAAAVTKSSRGRERSWETSLGDGSQEQPRREIMKGNKLGDKAAAAASPEATSGRETSLGDKAAAAAKSSLERKS